MLPSTLLVLLILQQNTPIFASYCGEDAIPFSLQALKSGQPVLGCARPSCFGWGTKRDKGARFYRIHKKNDGFMRRTDLKKYDSMKIAARKSQIANCEKNYLSSTCDEKTQWVGGLSPASNITEKPLLLQCCTFDSLRNSWDRGIAEVGPGQIVVGGEVMQGGRQYAFDYIANIKKYFTESGSVVYSVAVRRFSCIPYPTKSDLYVEESALPYIMDKISPTYEWNNPESINFQQLPQQLDNAMNSNNAASHQLSPGRHSSDFAESNPGISRVYMPILPSISVTPAKNPTQTGLFLSAQQHQPDTSVVQPAQPTATGREYQQIPQQPFVMPHQSGMQTIPQQYKYSAKPEQPVRQYAQSSQLIPPQPHASQFPTFPSFDHFDFSLT